MVESSDLQSAIQRTQAMERVASLQNQQEELNRKRFELEMARQSAERAKKAQDVTGAASKRVLRDRYDGDEQPPPEEQQQGEAGSEASADDRGTAEEGLREGNDPDDTPPVGGNLDVRV